LRYLQACSNYELKSVKEALSQLYLLQKDIEKTLKTGEGGAVLVGNVMEGEESVDFGGLQKRDDSLFDNQLND
jgi:hypothetical protein